jgi:hypothetical protein
VRRRCWSLTAMKSSTKTSMNAAGFERRLCVGRASDSTDGVRGASSSGSSLDRAAYAFALASAGGRQCWHRRRQVAHSSRLRGSSVDGPCGRCPYGWSSVDSSAADGRSVEDRRKITRKDGVGLTPSVPSGGEVSGACTGGIRNVARRLRHGTES